MADPIAVAVPVDQKIEHIPQDYLVNGPPGTQSGGTWYRETFANNHSSLFGCGCFDTLEGIFGSRDVKVEEERWLYCDPSGIFYTSQGHVTYIRGSLQRIPPAPVWQSFSPGGENPLVARNHSLMDSDDEEEADDYVVNIMASDLPPGTAPGGIWYKQTLNGRPRYVYREDPRAGRFYDTDGFRISPYQGDFDPPIGQLRR